MSGPARNVQRANRLKLPRSLGPRPLASRPDQRARARGRAGRDAGDRAPGRPLVRTRPMMNWTFTDLVAAKRQRVLTKSRSSDEIVALVQQGAKEFKAYEERGK